MIFRLKVFMLLMLTLLVTGCGDETPPTRVKAIKVLSTNAPLPLIFDGQIVLSDAVKVQSRISGKVSEIFAESGQSVNEGQTLFKIEVLQYESVALQAQTILAKSMTSLAKARVDLQHDEELSAQQAVSESTLAERRAKVAELETEVAENQALLKQAQDDLATATIYAPISGVLADVATVGTFSTADDTVLATIGTINPAGVQFTVSEAEYLRLSESPDAEISLTLADGSAYPYSGKFATFDDTLTVRTIFPNPDGVLLPDMKARVKIDGLKSTNSLLVPESAIQNISGDTSVVIVGSDNKSVVRKISLGKKIGSCCLVNEGLNSDDRVVVEGLTNLRDGVTLNVSSEN